MKDCLLQSIPLLIYTYFIHHLPQIIYRNRYACLTMLCPYHFNFCTEFGNQANSYLSCFIIHVNYLSLVSSSMFKGKLKRSINSNCRPPSSPLEIVHYFLKACVKFVPPPSEKLILSECASFFLTCGVSSLN